MTTPRQHSIKDHKNEPFDTKNRSKQSYKSVVKVMSSQKPLNQAINHEN